jgi:hypothetical protein
MRIVVKMRNIKKLLGNEMLQLAIMLSLMRFDSDSLLFPFSSGGSQNNSMMDIYDSNSDSGDLRTLSRYHDYLGGGGTGGLGDLSPRLHPKSMDAVLERFHAEILEDLNSLGSYHRIRPFRGEPVEISAYIVDTNGNRPTSSDGSGNNYADSDSGISDTEAMASGSDVDDSDTEKIKEEEEDVASPEPHLEDILDSELEIVGDPFEVLGGGGSRVLPPQKENEDDLVLPVSDPSELEDHLFQIDDQLITIDEDLEEISEEFLHLDEQLAVHITDQEETAILDDLDLLDSLDEVDYNAVPFDEWQVDSHRELDELLGQSNDLFTEGEGEKEETEVQGDCEANGYSSPSSTSVPSSPFAHKFNRSNRSIEDASPISTGSNDPSNRSRHNSEAAPDATLDQDESAWTGEGKFEHTSIEELLRAPPTYPGDLIAGNNVTLGGANLNDSFPAPFSDGAGMGYHHHHGISAAAASGTVTNTTQTTDAQQHSAAAELLGLSHATSNDDIIKELVNSFGSREMQDVENSCWGRPPAHNGHHHHHQQQQQQQQQHPLDMAHSFSSSGPDMTSNNVGPYAAIAASSSMLNAHQRL